jgi:magnesium-transporting ATPase (P-type)
LFSVSEKVLTGNVSGVTYDDEDLAWHAADADEVLARLNSRAEGLGKSEVVEYLTRYGPNRLPDPPRRGPIARFLEQFKNALVLVLVGAGLATALLAHFADSAVILAVVLVNAIIGFIQEGRAQQAIDAIRVMLAPRAAVLRDGRRCDLKAEALVPGDIVLLQSGDRVPADLRLLWTRSLEVDEAVLTGESSAVEKSVLPVSAEAPLSERRSMTYSGTLVTRGRARGVVTATGAATEIGQIGSLVAEVEMLTTPLLRQMSVFARWLTVVILGAAALTFTFGVLARGFSPTEMFLAAIGLSVAAIPEGLPAIMTITLAIGVRRMARRNVIIRRLPAVETLGSVTVICSDKTGTLTRNEITAQTIATADREFAITGVGNVSHGGFEEAGKPIEAHDYPRLTEIVRAALLCNDATVRREDGHWTIAGDPTEGALAVAALKAGLDPIFEREAAPRDDVIPFESQYRFMASLHHDHAGNSFVIVKGAPERVLGMCAAERRDDGQNVPIDLHAWHALGAALARQGHRLMALALKPLDEATRALRYDDVDSGLVMLGLFGLLDPPREEAANAIARCHAAGIKLKMITGDHSATAAAIAARLGISNPSGPLNCQELDGLDEAKLREVVQEVDVFARAVPEHKLRILEALQADGEVVAMTGDGVNDAPALKRADIGIAMGLKGTEAAKEAAEMVLADDDFATIVAAVEEGRTVNDNLKKAIAYILPTGAGEALIIVAAVLFGHVLPLTAIQILWVNMITAVSLSLALIFEPAEHNIIHRPPRPPNEPLLSGHIVWRTLFVSLLVLVSAFSLFMWMEERGADLETARTAVVNAVVLFEVFYLFNVRRQDGPAVVSAFTRAALPAWYAAGFVVGLQILFTHAEPMWALFQSRPLAPVEWVGSACVGVTIFILVEIEKWLLRRRHVTA